MMDIVRGAGPNLRVVIGRKPIGKARPRMSPGGGVYTPAATKDWEVFAATEIRRRMTGHWVRGTSGAVSVSITAQFKNAKRYHDPMTSKPDADNIAKIVLDAMVLAGVITDDRYVIHLDVTKCYGPEDCVTVELQEVLGCV